MIDFGWRKSEGHGDIIQMKILSEIDYIFMYVAFIRFVRADWKKITNLLFQTGKWVYCASYLFSKYCTLSQISLKIVSPY